MKVTALLPMKGNSERVPNKNLKDFYGKPLYHRVLSTLLDSKYITEIIINTDSMLLKEDILKHFPKKVKIHDRPESIQGDMVSMNKIIEFDLNNSDGDIFLQTHSTNPLLKVQSLNDAIERMLNKGGDMFDSIFSVTKLQTRLYDEKGKPFNHNPEELLRTQDLPPLYEENSNFYIFSKDSFFENEKKRIGKNPLMFQIDKIEAIDIDEPQDFIIAESLFKILRSNDL
ncbi:cytidylyltransferase domain-containing protein [Zhouia amylolytica]|uniref:acylneuraminate cytidylyltransferase family protein n=1 Tax=Zhouia amylolytica TaxID=376730 RepID=UPI0020CC0CB4|nr:acylneuraminate cytidylyltransferase family protein [Zhouia amylolytica]MCQ0113116.1 acylneuraminate cytidylyltransferase family protein [Zhouia amylolytica]